MDAPTQPEGICDKLKDLRVILNLITLTNYEAALQHLCLCCQSLEADISAIYESIARRTIARISL